MAEAKSGQSVPSEAGVPEKLELPIGSDLRVAIHEAGHAVAFYLLYDRVPERLTLESRADTLGGMLPAPPLDEDNLPECASNKAEAKRFIRPLMVYYAGAVAVSLFADCAYACEDNDLGDGSDEARRGFDQGFNNGKRNSDVNRINNLAWRANCCGQHESTATLEAACQKTRDQLENWRATIWTVANCLLGSRTLTSNELGQLLGVRPEQVDG